MGARAGRRAGKQPRAAQERHPGRGVRDCVESGIGICSRRCHLPDRAAVNHRAQPTKPAEAGFASVARAKRTPRVVNFASHDLLCYHRAVTVKLIRLLLLLMLVGVAALVWATALFETSHAARIYEGVSAFNVDLSGLTRDDARAALRSRLNPTQRIYLRDGAQRFSLSLSELGITLDDTTVLNAAFSIGRGGGWFDNLQEQFTARLYGQSLPTSLMMDEGVAQVALKRLARQVERAPRDATVALVGAQVLSEPASTGRALDVNETIARLKQSIGQGSAEGLEIALAVNEEQPVVRDAGDGVNQMRAMLAGPLRLTMSDRAWLETGRTATGLQLVSSQQDRSWLLDTAALAAMLNVKQVQRNDGQATLSVSVDDAKLTDFL